MKKMIFAILTIAALGCATASASAADINIAAGLPVTVTTHNYNATGTPVTSTELTDGDDATRYYVSGIWGTDAEIDLGTARHIGGIRLYRRLWHSTPALTGQTVNMTVKISMDGEVYTNIGIMQIDTKEQTVDGDYTTKWQELTLNGIDIKARYIQLLDLDGHDGTANTLYELSVTPYRDNLAAGKTVSVTRYAYDGSGNKSSFVYDDRTLYTDGDTTEYLGGGQFHMDAQMDLGEIKTIGGAKIYRRMIWLSGNAINNTNTSVSVSTDGTTWKTVGTMTKMGLNADSTNTTTYQILTIDCPAVEARYIKFEETQNHNGVSTGFSEIMVYEESRRNIALGGSVAFFDVDGSPRAESGVAKAAWAVDGDPSTPSRGGNYQYHTVLTLNNKAYADTVQVSYQDNNVDNVRLYVYISADGTTYVPAGKLRRIADKLYEATFKPQIVKNIKIFDLDGDLSQRANNQCTMTEIDVFETDASYGVDYTVSGATAESLQNGTIKSELISNKLAGGLMFTALYDSEGRFISCDMKDIAENAPYLEMPVNVAEVGAITPRTNIAEGKTAYLRNVTNTGDLNASNSRYPRTANYLTDGDPITCAIPSGQYQSMMKVDLGAEYNLSEIEVNFIRASDNYEIAVSTDDSAYTTLYTCQDPTGGLKSYKVNGQRARYIAIFNKTTKNIIQYVAEIRAYEPTAEKWSMKTFVWNSLDSENGLAPLGTIFTLTN